MAERRQRRKKIRLTSPSEERRKKIRLTSPSEEEKGSSKLIVAAIDFGTTYSGRAFQFLHEYKENPTKINAKNWNNGSNISSKAPTTVLIQPDGKTFEAFGYEAEDRYAELVREENGHHKEWYYFSRFKMMLYENLANRADPDQTAPVGAGWSGSSLFANALKCVTMRERTKSLNVVALLQKLKRGMFLEASNGKTLPALDVYAAAIKYLKDDAMDGCRIQIAGEIKDDDVLWVLTVPAIWSDAAKQFMREAGTKAGIKDDNLILALEPETASIFCKHDSLQKQTKTDVVTSFSPGTKYIVLDAGGGTVDITAHEILPGGNIKELYRPCGGHWGGTTVDRKFNQFLKDIFGPVVFEIFCKEAPDDVATLYRSFEVKKRDVSITSSKPIVIDIPFCLAEVYRDKTGRTVNEAVNHSKYTCNKSVSILKGNKLRVGSDIMKGFFDEAVPNIVSQIGGMLKDDYVKTCDTILLVGGFSESPMIQEALRKEFKQLRLINPKDASLVVLKGAVLFGRQQTIISHRICRFTYGYALKMAFEDGDPEESAEFNERGVKICSGRFQSIVCCDTILKTNEKYISNKDCAPEKGDGFTLQVYKSRKTHPRYVTEPDCEMVGRLKIHDLAKSDNVCKVGGKFGGTEIQMEIVHKTTGRTVSATFDNLD